MMGARQFAAYRIHIAVHHGSLELDGLAPNGDSETSLITEPKSGTPINRGSSILYIVSPGCARSQKGWL
jgi:hypothetical protein